MICCSVIGATGYTGVELIRLLRRHSSVSLGALTTRQADPIPLRQLIPELSKNDGGEVRKHTFAEVKKMSDVVFLCLPHTEAMDTAARYMDAGKIVIDLSADFRLHDTGVYQSWYGVKHTQKRYLKEAVYGLSEWNREKIRGARLIANPGCYPTGASLGLLPLIKNALVERDSIVIDAKSGVSGAGKKLSSSSQYCELSENFYAYRVGKHQHTPEIEQTLAELGGKKAKVQFTTHLLPVKRGILSTIYVTPRKKVSWKQLAQIYREAYKKAPFVRILPEGEFPQLSSVRNTNFCDIGFYADPRTGKVIVITAIDNLLKGASGQAVQNMNLCLGLPEETGF